MIRTLATARLVAPSLALLKRNSSNVTGQRASDVSAGDTLQLTPAQRRQYDELGYVVLRKMVPGPELDTYGERFLDICSGKVPKGRMLVMKDVSLLDSDRSGESVTYKVQDFTHDPVLFEYCRSPSIMKVVKEFCGPNVMAVHTMLINKPPDAGTLSSRHPMHQDLYYFPFRPENLVVAAWTAMEKVTRANGCLVVLPGTHKGPLLEHGYPDWQGKVNKMYHGIQNLDPKTIDARVHVEMDKGDTVFFHPLLIHGSGANRTQGFRKAISCHFAASECEYVDVTGTIQEAVAREVEDVARRYRGLDLSYVDIWKYRSRLVSGKRINL